MERFQLARISNIHSVSFTNCHYELQSIDDIRKLSPLPMKSLIASLPEYHGFAIVTLNRLITLFNRHRNMVTSAPIIIEPQASFMSGRFADD